ncbi:MAG: amidohydrolase [Spirochaetes bacterium]|jgi:hypothetical protein|nr:amidohydrolase [Spirochaetota bacterium]
MVVDFHMHLFNEAPCLKRDRYFDDANFKMIYGDRRARIAGLDSIAGYMDGSGIDIGVVMSFSWIKSGYSREQNNYLGGVVRASEGRIRAFGSIPMDAGRATDGWAGEIADLGLSGIGEIGFYSPGFDGEALSYLRSVLESARRFSLPVSIHVNEPVGHLYSGKYEPGFERLYDLLRDFADVTIILSHWGGGLFFYELMPEVAESFRNFYYDNAATPYLYDGRIYRAALDIIGSKRILFGSDYPLLKLERYVEVMRDNLRDEVFYGDIMGGNAAVLLGL